LNYQVYIVFITRMTHLACLPFLVLNAFCCNNSSKYKIFYLIVCFFFEIMHFSNDNCFFFFPDDQSGILVALIKTEDPDYQIDPSDPSDQNPSPVVWR